MLVPVAYGDGDAPSARLLGVTESAPNYCGSRDPTAAARLRERIKELVQGAGEQQLAEVRKGEEYRRAYDSVVEFTAKIDPHNVRTFCAEVGVGRK